MENLISQSRTFGSIHIEWAKHETNASLDVVEAVEPHPLGNTNVNRPHSVQSRIWITFSKPFSNYLARNLVLV